MSIDEGGEVDRHRFLRVTFGHYFGMDEAQVCSAMKRFM